MNLKHGSRHSHIHHKNSFTWQSAATQLLSAGAAGWCSNLPLACRGKIARKPPYNNRQGHELESAWSCGTLSRELKVGSVVNVKNQQGMPVSARIVAQLPGFSTYAAELLDEDDTAKNFWGISFPTSASSKSQA